MGGAGVDSVGTTVPKRGKQSSAWQQLMPPEQSRGASRSRQEEAPHPKSEGDIWGISVLSFVGLGTATISLGLNI